MEAKKTELGLACKCGCTRWRVVYVRPIAGGLKRRRECKNCGSKLFSKEYFEKNDTESSTDVTPR